MRIINQNIMNQLFATTDGIPLDREAVQVPLAMEGEGKVARTAKGKIEITLPDAEDLEPFLAALPAKVRELG
jgi:hypothetical protein